LLMALVWYSVTTFGVELCREEDLHIDLEVVSCLG
jgi:hypothetical protein